MFERIPEDCSDKLAAAVEAVFFPRGIDII
jgi:hypothetical protein